MPSGFHLDFDNIFQISYHRSLAFLANRIPYTKNNQHELGEKFPADFEIPLAAEDYDLIGGGLTLCIGIEI